MATVVDQLRKICLALPNANETSNHGHPNFKIKGRMFCEYHGWEGDEAIAVKVGREMQDVFVKDPRFYRTPYLAHHGFISLKTVGFPINWAEVKSLVQESYRLVQAKKPPRTK